MKLPLTALTVLLAPSLFAQIKVIDAPKDYQLFPRNAENKATVRFSVLSPVSGTAKFQTLENGKLLQERFENFQANDTMTFESTIEAKPSEYSFSLQIGTQVLERKHIVCGDFLILYGQSNIKALSGIDDFRIDTRLLRNFDTRHPSLPNEWSTADLPYGSVGIVGLQLQALILEKYGIPTCVINASRGGASLYSLLEHGEYYKTLKERVHGAGAKGHIKAIVWRQGEAETCNWYKDIEEYPMHFAQLMQVINQDFPEYKKFYNIQTGILHCNQMEDAGKLREYMRQTRYLFPKVETTNMHKLPLSDDVHYSKDAYIQTAKELLPLLGRDLYGDRDYPEIRPPDIQNIYLTPQGDTLILEFEKGQNLYFPAPTTQNGLEWKMEDYFYVNTTTQAQHNLIQKGWASENRVYLKLNWQVQTGFVTYLPSFAKSAPPVHPVHITNSSGLRAMSFYQFPFKSLLPTPKITSVQLTSNEQVRITFAEKGTYTLERKKGGESTFTTIATVEESDHYLDRADFTQEVSYRLQRVTPDAVSDFSPIVSYNFSAEIRSVEPSLILQNRIEPIILKGRNFGTETGKVEIQGEQAQILSWKNEEISFIPPQTIPSGSLTIKVLTALNQELRAALSVDPLLAYSLEKVSVLYPQPLTGKDALHLQAKQEINSAIAYDLLGKPTPLALKETLPKIYLIDTSLLPAGIYSVILSGKQGRETLRFQKL